MREYVGGLFTLLSIGFALIILVWLTRIELVTVEPTQRSQVAAAVTDVIDVTAPVEIQAINRVRIAHGVPAIRFDGSLSSLAEKRTADMVERSYYSHQSPDGLYFYDYAEIAGYSCENLHLHPSTDIDQTLQQWLDSPAHRSCLLDPRLSRGGIDMQRYDEIDFPDGPRDVYVYALIAAQ